MTCIGTWREAEAAEAVEAIVDPEIGSNATQSLVEAKYPRILALRDQKGSGECLEYRKIENSLQVSLMPRCQYQEHSKVQNFALKGSCQEALRDHKSLSFGVKSSENSFGILIVTVTVIWNF